MSDPVDLTPLLRLWHPHDHPIERFVRTGELPQLKGTRTAGERPRRNGPPRTFVFISADARRAHRNARLALWDIVHRAVASPHSATVAAGRELERRLQGTMVDIDMDTTREYAGPAHAADDDNDEADADDIGHEDMSTGGAV